jgi:hypothetical protein
VRGTTRPDEIRVVGVGESVRLRARLTHDGALLELEHEPTSAGEGERVLDGAPSLRVRDGVATAVGDGERRELGEERGSVERVRADLEVQRRRRRQRPRAEERAANVRAAAAGARDDRRRRQRQRDEVGAEDARAAQHLDRVGAARHVELVPRPAVERTSAVRADLGLDAERTEEREGPAGDGRRGEVEVQRDLAPAAQVDAPRRVEEA